MTAEVAGRPSSLTRHREAKQPDKALELLQEMRQFGLEPDVITFGKATSVARRFSSKGKGAREGLAALG